MCNEHEFKVGDTVECVNEKIHPLDLEFFGSQKVKKTKIKGSYDSKDVRLMVSVTSSWDWYYCNEVRRVDNEE